jgi:hypothetical protein
MQLAETIVYAYLLLFTISYFIFWAWFLYEIIDGFRHIYAQDWAVSCLVALILAMYFPFSIPTLIIVRTYYKRKHSAPKT